MSKKRILILKSPFKGIGKNIGDLIREHEKSVDFLALKYYGGNSINNEYRDEEIYDPKDIRLGKSKQWKDNKEIVSLRFSDIINSLRYFDTIFKKSDNRLILAPKHPFHDAKYESENQPAIEKVANMIYTVDGILPVWIEDMGGVGFSRAIEKIYEFFDAIVAQKSGLFLSRNPVEKQTPSAAISDYLRKA